MRGCGRAGGGGGSFPAVFPCNNAAQPLCVSLAEDAALCKRLLLSPTWPRAWAHQRQETDEALHRRPNKEPSLCVSLWGTDRDAPWPLGPPLMLLAASRKFRLLDKLMSVILRPGPYSTPQTHTQARPAIVVRTLIDIMHSLAPYPNLNHHNQMPDPNLNIILTLTLKPSLNRQTAHWKCEDRTKCPHIDGISEDTHWHNTFPSPFP